MKPTTQEAMNVVRSGLGQLTVIGLHKAKKTIADHPDDILMDGKVFLDHRY